MHRVVVVGQIPHPLAVRGGGLADHVVPLASGAALPQGLGLLLTGTGFADQVMVGQGPAAVPNRRLLVEGDQGVVLLVEGDQGVVSLLVVDVVVVLGRVELQEG